MQDDKNFISVIIATCNRYVSLKSTLKSLSNQENDTSFDYEIIVIDNNSSDRTKEVVEEFDKAMSGRLRYVFEPRQGKPSALNTGIKLAKGDIIAFTDDDVVVFRDWIKNIYQAFKKMGFRA